MLMTLWRKGVFLYNTVFVQLFYPTCNEPGVVRCTNSAGDNLRLLSQMFCGGKFLVAKAAHSEVKGVFKKQLFQKHYSYCSAYKGETGFFYIADLQVNATTILTCYKSIVAS